MITPTEAKLMLRSTKASQRTFFIKIIALQCRVVDCAWKTKVKGVFGKTNYYASHVHLLIPRRCATVGNSGATVGNSENQSWISPPAITQVAAICLQTCIGPLDRALPGMVAKRGAASPVRGVYISEGHSEEGGGPVCLVLADVALPNQTALGLAQ